MGWDDPAPGFINVVSPFKENSTPISCNIGDPAGGAGALPGALQPHSGTVASIAVSPDGSTMATGGFDASVKLWAGTPKTAVL